METKNYIVSGSNKILTYEDAVFESNKQSIQNITQILSTKRIINYTTTESRGYDNYETVNCEHIYNELKPKITLEMIELCIDQIENSNLLIKKIKIEI